MIANTIKKKKRERENVWKCIPHHVPKRSEFFYNYLSLAYMVRIFPEKLFWSKIYVLAKPCGKKKKLADMNMKLHFFSTKKKKKIQALIVIYCALLLSFFLAKSTESTEFNKLIYYLLEGVEDICTLSKSYQHLLKIMQ